MERKLFTIATTLAINASIRLATKITKRIFATNFAAPKIMLRIIIKGTRIAQIT